MVLETNWINDKMNERKEVCQNEGNHTKAHMSVEVSQLTADLKRRSWQC